MSGEEPVRPRDARRIAPAARGRSPQPLRREGQAPLRLSASAEQARQVGARADAELRVDRREVPFDGLLGDEQDLLP